MGLIVSCSTPTTPKFPDIDCKPIMKLTKSQLEELSHCKKDVNVCSIPRNTFMQIFNNYQKRAACLETYKETAKEFQ
jgi:hypothetical protein